VTATAPPAGALPTEAVRDPDLGSLIANRRWMRSSDPFPHVAVRDVFTPAFAAELDSAFAAILERGLDAGPRGFSRSIPGYDAFGHTFRADVGWPFSVFVSRPWHDLLCDVADIKGSGQVFCGLHHHLPGSRSGSIHNDLNPGWFQDVAGPGEVVVCDQRRVVYSSGEARVSGVTPSGAVRGVALLYFLRNGPWHPGDGGELGLYSSYGDAIDRPAVTVAPHDNSLVLFECTPHSLHGFIHNRRTPRNSLIMWVHRPRPDVVAQWGARAIIDWPRGRPAASGP
jgi:hypothetical protein